MLYLRCKRKRAGYFVRLSVLIFRAELAYFFFFCARSVGRRRRSVWDSCLCRRPTHLMGPLVNDHLIYCNITHTRTINERRRPREKKKSEELKWKRFPACKTGCFRARIFLHPPLDIGDLKRSILGLIGLNGWGLLERTNVRMSLQKTRSRDRCSFASTHYSFSQKRNIVFRRCVLLLLIQLHDKWNKVYELRIKSIFAYPYLLIITIMTQVEIYRRVQRNKRIKVSIKDCDSTLILLS